MRYLGKVLEKVDREKFRHLEFLLEKEMVIRGFKHLLNKWLRETPETYKS